MVAKTRPVLILSVAYIDQERSLVTFVPRTTSVRGTRFEVVHTGRGFETGVFDAQGVATVPTVQLVRRLGMIDGATLALVEAAVKRWLGLT
ncbi:MAG: type II toxin-antitoxin system PemK/MazF family toxin [Opitutae bacterium]|nr:type II toxin-antitoxin system PemK/MazF family toxin [Opitutae bacterium]